MIVTSQTIRINVPAIQTQAGIAIASNPERQGWNIQNLGTNPLTVFHQVLKGGTGNDDGLGASMGETSGTVYTGTIYVAGTSPRFTILEH